MTPPILAASILSADLTNLRDQVQQAVDAGVDWVHIDVMDGHFVPNITFGALMVEACRRITSLPLDVHLMIEKPERYIADFARAGANKLTIHIEGNPHIHRTLDAIRALDVSPTVVLNPGTPAASLDAVLPMVDMVLVMTVNPGFGGQRFIQPVVGKIRQVRAALDAVNPAALVQVDGGIDVTTAPQAYAAGAQAFVVGNAIFKHPQGIAAAVASLRRCLTA